MTNRNKKFILWFDELGIKDVPLVGGKNASLGEMYQKLSKKGVTVPNGFAVTAYAYHYFLEKAEIADDIKKTFTGLDVCDIKSLSCQGDKARDLILRSSLPKDLEKAIIQAYEKMEKIYGHDCDVAVRSSATAEDLPDASFAGQQETYLNIRGKYTLIDTCRRCFASIFTDRAIAYREEKKFDHFTIGLSIGVQKMVRSDLGASGVMFSIDTESGFKDAVLINAAYGLGENVVQGAVNPDEFYVFKPTLKKGFKPIINKKLGEKRIKMVYNHKIINPVKNVNVTINDRHKFCINDKEVLQLAKWATIIEDHYKRPMDMEWAKDGKSGDLFIVQARPETVQSRRDTSVLEDYKLQEKGKVLCKGDPVGSKIGSGPAHVIADVDEISQFKSGEVLVTDMTDPDWVPIMKKAAAIVTNRGGRTCFSGDTILLTNKGYLTIEEITKKYKKENLKVISINEKSLKLEWKKVTCGMVRKTDLISVNISQTGRMKNNNLKLTQDHKVLTFKDRQLVSKEIKDILQNKEYLISSNKIPANQTDLIKLKNKYYNFHQSLAYLLGGILTDGSIYLSKTHGEVQFIQKNTEEKKKFIKKMDKCLQEIFKYSFHATIKKISTGKIRGKKVVGQANAYRCYSKKIAQEMKSLKDSLVNALLCADEKFIYNFLAGVVDGDGTYNEKSNRINIFCSNDNLLQAVNIACLRLNIAFSVTNNRSIHNVQIVDKINNIFKYTQRVKGEYNRIIVGTKLFSAKQLLEDIKEKINYKGRILPYIKNNFLIDAEKIKNCLIPMIKGEVQNHELTNIVNSDLKMLRVGMDKKLGKQNVYNITVADNHNYLVFTNRYTPVLVNNCHAAIVSRELGIPCIVGTNDATSSISTKQNITVSCAEGEIGFVYKGKLKFNVKKVNIKNIKRPKTKIMMNVGSPDQAFSSSFIPNDGVGLAREEFVISSYIKIHPLALINFNKLKDSQTKEEINKLTIGYKNKKQYFIDKLAQGVSMITAAFYPKDVIVRLSDFKSDEYANLIGGKEFEPKEDNPMLGWRGASRYYSQKYRPAFDLECKALKKVRNEMGLNNLKIMVPFCRTVEEGKKVLQIMKENGLVRGQNGLEIYVMCEIPSNVILAKEFAKIFDGFSIGSNDLTQLALGVDRNSELVSHIYNERNTAVKNLISNVIKDTKKLKKKIGICGQGPSDFPDFAKFLVEQKIDSISLNPDTVIKTTLDILKVEGSKL